MSDVLPEPDGEGRWRLDEFLAGLPDSPSAVMAAFAALQTAEAAELAAPGHPSFGSVVSGASPLAVKARED